MSWNFNPALIEAGNGVRIAYTGSRARVVAGTVAGVFGNILVVEHTARGRHQSVVVNADEIGNGAVTFIWTRVDGSIHQFPGTPVVVDGGGGGGTGGASNTVQLTVSLSLTVKVWNTGRT